MPHIPLSREISPLRALAAGLLCVSLTACSPPAASVPRAMLSGNDMELPRAHPGYVQWLEKQSILRQSEKLLSVVWRLHIISGSILFPTIPRRRKQNNLSNDRIRRKSPQIQSKQRRLRTKPDAAPVRFQSSIAGLAANGLNVIRA